MDRDVHGEEGWKIVQFISAIMKSKVIHWSLQIEWFSAASIPALRTQFSNDG